MCPLRLQIKVVTLEGEIVDTLPSQIESISYFNPECLKIMLIKSGEPYAREICRWSGDEVGMAFRCIGRMVAEDAYD